MTSFLSHTNFTNSLKITNLAASPTKSNYPKLLLILHTGEQAFSRRCLSSTVTDVVVMEVKLLQTSIGLKAFCQGLVNSCRGETGGIHPLSPTWLRTEHTLGQIYRVPNIQWTESRGDHLSRSQFLCSYSRSCWGSLQIRIFKIRHPNIRLQGTANNAVTRSGSASKELASKTST